MSLRPLRKREFSPMSILLMHHYYAPSLFAIDITLLFLCSMSTGFLKWRPDYVEAEGSYQKAGK